MNIIFLDVDGVLTSINKLIEVYKKTGKPHSGVNYPFDEVCLKNLYSLVEMTQSKLVISSTWKKYEDHMKKLLEVLEQYKLKDKVIGYTPNLNTTRSDEIKAFLQGIQGNYNFIILDDNTVDNDELIPFLILTNNQTGLTKENVTEGVNRLMMNVENSDKKLQCKRD